MNSQNGNNRFATAEPTASQCREKLGVLVIDGDHLVRIMVQLGLERKGFDVHLAANGREAIDLYRTRSEEIAVVLLDFRLPGLDGPRTLDALRALNPELPACFMGDNIGKPSELVARDAARVIAKPFLLDDLADTLLQLVGDAYANTRPSIQLA